MTTWQADDPKEVQRLVDQYEPYGAPLLEEREEAQMRFFELVDGARAELLGVLAEDATDDTVSTRILGRRTAPFPPVLIPHPASRMV